MVGASGNRAILDTLALAYHRTGETAKAIETEEKAVALLPPGDAGSRATMVSLCLKGDVNSAVRR